MIKKTIALAMAAGFVFTGGLVYAKEQQFRDIKTQTTAIVERQSAEEKNEDKNVEAKEKMMQNKEGVPSADRLKKMAEKLGIKTEGLTEEQIKAAVKAKMSEIRKLSQEERLQRMADKLGIDTKGKTKEQIKEEIKAKMPKEMKQKLSPEERILKMAEKLGIDTKDKTMDQLKIEIKDKLKDMKPENKQENKQQNKTK